MKNPYSYFCSGCGLCKYNHTEFEKDSSGFEFPKNMNNDQVLFCDKYCHAGKNRIQKKYKNIWGNYLAVYEGYALDASVRYAASSGGVLTAIGIYLLEKKLVDGIIQVRRDPSCPYKTITVCSTQKSEVVASCGSRYCQSEPLKNIFDLIEDNKTYAFIGKPCDVTILRNYIKENPYLEKRIMYMFSFFCAGMPSEKANIKLLSTMGCDVDSVEYLDYRGNGWPGKTTATDKNDKKYYMNYEKSWMEILGRDIRNCCKFCFDGIGESSDISCGDLWYLTDDNRPDFEEKDGRNVIFAWTEKGLQLLDEMQKELVVNIDDYSNKIDQLKCCQPNHFMKRSTILSKVMALKIMGRATPKYKFTLLLSTARYSRLKTLIGTFIGTVKRIRNKKV